MRFIRFLLHALTILHVAHPASGGESVLLNDADLLWLPDGLRTATLPLAPQDRALPIAAPSLPGEAAALLREFDAQGLAIGFEGIVYDNRDRGHSSLDPSLFPRLGRLSYGFELVAEDADYGLAGRFLLSPVVFGNSSTAITSGPAPRSLPRYAMTTPGGPEAQARLYASDDIYVYPEHRDHDAEDLFPANWPYLIVSQGSSGSDQPFLQAIAMTLAAFPPKTMARMRDLGLVASTLQVILRSSLRTVSTRDEYLSGAAHPAVFNSAELRPERMVLAAASMEPDDIPPAVRIHVTHEEFGGSEGLARLDERLFDTPSAIARVWRSFAWDRRMTVSAEATEDPAGRPLRFSWVVLQGRPDLVAITPLDPDGRQAEITIAWHDAFRVAGSDAIRVSSRVDIGVFALSAETVSAPAIISISFPTHEVRSYEPSSRGNMQLASIDYDAIERGQSYDPVLHWSAPWSDVPIRDASGAISAWARTSRDGSLERVAYSEVRGAMDYVIDRSDARPPVLSVVTRSR